MPFLVQIHDACSSSGDAVVYENAEEAQLALGIESWEVTEGGDWSGFTHKAEISRYYDDPNYADEDDDPGAENLYVSGKYVEFGEKIDFYN